VDKEVHMTTTTARDAHTATATAAKPRKHEVRLDAGQRERLERLVNNGSGKAKRITHARVLLMSDRDHPAGRYKDGQIAAALAVHVNTVGRVRTAFALRGEGPALDRRPRATPAVTPKLDGRAEATLAAVCCSPAPQGRARWTLSLLCEALVGRGVVTSIARETVRKALKKTS
jgi:hypothetical protein